MLKFPTRRCHVNVWYEMDMCNPWHTARCICPRLSPMYVWNILQGPFRSWIACCMMGGAFMIRGMVRIGVSMITLCSSSLTFCCSLVTFCSVLGVAVDGGGLRMVCRLDCNNFNRHLPLLVEAATAIVSRSSSVRARRCWCGDMFGIWQCWGKSSADPDMQYARISGT